MSFLIARTLLSFPPKVYNVIIIIITWRANRMSFAYNAFAISLLLSLLLHKFCPASSPMPDDPRPIVLYKLSIMVEQLWWLKCCWRWKNSCFWIDNFHKQIPIIIFQQHFLLPIWSLCTSFFCEGIHEAKDNTTHWQLDNARESFEIKWTFINWQ